MYSDSVKSRANCLCNGICNKNGKMVPLGSQRNSRSYTIISVIVLSFYIWAFGGLSSIAHAAKDALNQAQIRKKTQEAEQSPEERFAKATEEIEAILADPKTDFSTKKEKIKKQKGIIEALDSETRKGFAETEKTLEEANLPDEILNRHYRFVKHYEDKLNELKANLGSFEKANDQEAAAKVIEKTRAQLKKMRPEKKHRPLDPDNLPHRTRKPIKKEPRLNREAFERDFGKDQAILNSHKSILVATTGSLYGLLSPSSVTAANSPTLEDLAETIEIKFTPDITAKAEELGHSPVKIYNWVRNNIEFVPTYGSIQGAQMTLKTKQGNAFDTASLLIALLRVSGIHARYVMGTVEIPVEQVMNWAGGFTDPRAALDFIASGGIPVQALIDGGKIVKTRMEHVWAEAYIDYLPSRGSRHRQGDTWIPLDPGFKQYNYTAPSIDIKTAVPFDAETFIEQIEASATINEAEGYATGIDSLLIQDTLQDYQSQVENYISQKQPDATVGEVLGKKEIITQDFSYLLGTLPYRTAVKGGSYASLPDTLRHKITFVVEKDSFDDMPLYITKSLPELAGKKITLSYSPATPGDEAVINSYLPEPHPDGTPIEPKELPDSLPAYLINVTPELRIDGQIAATGAAVGLGTTETFTMQFYDPAVTESPIVNTIDAGAYLAIGLNLGRIAEDQMIGLEAKLKMTKAKLEAKEYSDITKEDVLGDLLYATAIMYHSELGVANVVAAKTLGVSAITLPSETIFSSQLKVDTFFGIPRSVSADGLAMDADRLLNVVKALDGDNNKAVQFILNSGMTSSALEHGVPEQLFSTLEDPAEGISAVKALKIANDHGIPIYTIEQSNIATILPKLQIDPLAKMDIENAVNAGKVVTVSKESIDFYGWTGCGYIIIDPATGAGAYIISGGLSGGCLILLWASQFLLSIMLPAWGILVGSLVAILGSYLIRMSEVPDTSFLTPGQAIGAFLDIVVQTTMTAGLIALKLAALGPIGLIPFTIFIVTMAIIDFGVFFYACYWHDNPCYLAMSSATNMGPLTKGFCHKHGTTRFP
jgi:hypothetical protein